MAIRSRRCRSLSPNHSAAWTTVNHSRSATDSGRSTRQPGHVTCSQALVTLPIGAHVRQGVSTQVAKSSASRSQVSLSR